jgi:hypothetical protein
MGMGGSRSRNDGVRLPDYSLVPTIIKFLVGREADHKGLVFRKGRQAACAQTDIGVNLKEGLQRRTGFHHILVHLQANWYFGALGGSV